MGIPVERHDERYKNRQDEVLYMDFCRDVFPVEPFEERGVYMER